MTRVNLIGIGIAVCAATASAQSPAAEALFQEGRRLIKQGRLEAGCDKLAASQQLETSIGTLLNLGDCRERLGKLASAWAAFDRTRHEAARNRRCDEGRLAFDVAEVMRHGRTTVECCEDLPAGTLSGQ